MNECTCFLLLREEWYTHYGTPEPGSMYEPNPDCPEHFRKRGQVCKDCNGFGNRSEYGADFVCLTCDGEGIISRAGPYKLKDDTWSDGVNRSKRIAERDTTPWRWEVTLLGLNVNRPWRAFVLHSEVHWESRYYCTHAEAIAYADRMARTNQGGGE